jgi:hypothetical protein
MLCRSQAVCDSLQALIGFLLKPVACLNERCGGKHLDWQRYETPIYVAYVVPYIFRMVQDI